MKAMKVMKSMKSKKADDEEMPAMKGSLSPATFEEASFEQVQKA